MHETQVTPHVQCGTDPSMIQPHTRPSRNRLTAKVDHQGSRTDFLWKNTTHETVSHPSRSRSRSSTFGGKHMVSYSCFLSKTNFVLGFVQNSIANSPNSTTCNPIFTKGTVLKLQITMQFHRQLVHQRSYNHKSQLNSVDRKNTKHRWHPMYNPWKTKTFVNGVPLKRISCETSFNNRWATPPPAQLAIPFTVREQFL